MSWNRVLSTEEANCYWMKYPNVAKTFQDQGLPLNAKSASYSWNFKANETGERRDVICAT